VLKVNIANIVCCQNLQY